MSYHITKYSYDQAKKLNVDIKPSSNKKKKIDVFKDHKKIASIGSIGYLDFPNFVIKKGLDYANERRKLYKQRHKKDLNGKNGFYANKILW
jgi:hypothetical protein